MEEIKEEPNIPYVDLKRVFAAPTQGIAGDLGINNPYALKNWWNSIQAFPPSDYYGRAKLYYQGLQYLPGSYKLWWNFLKESRKSVKGKYKITDGRFEVVNKLHEEALVFMSKMPTIWLDYSKFLNYQEFISRTRDVYDRSLKSLPVTQHDLIWRVYKEWGEKMSCKETGKSIMGRYIQYNPEDKEMYVSYLLNIGEHSLAIKQLMSILSDESFASSKGSSKYQMWMLLAQLISQNAHNLQINIEGEDIIRQAIRLYTDEVGQLWVQLANYFIRFGEFNAARDVFEEAIHNIATAADFGIIFNAYAKFEEQLIPIAINNLKESENEMDTTDKISKLIDLTFDKLEINEGERELLQIGDEEMKSGEETKISSTKEEELELQMFRFENLLERRPFLLTHVLLRQNPHNVYQWLNLVKLCQFDDHLVIKTYTQALIQIDPMKAFGKPTQLWIEFAKFYEEHGDLSNANQIFKKASEISLRTVEEKGEIWCEWGEMQLRGKNITSARRILREAVGNREKRSTESSGGPGNCLRVWSFYVDLEEEYGEIESTKEIYKTMIDLHLASPQTIMNYGAFLEEHKYYEESFQLYEKAINMFSWPHLYDIWVLYLTKFIERYSGTKLERIRDLFEQVLASCPNDRAKIFYYMYGDVEENFGLLNRTLEIFDRAINKLPKDQIFEVLRVCLAKTTKLFGVTKTRKVYEKALEILAPGPQLLEMGLKFSKMERKLGEIDRARGIYMHLSQFFNPEIEDNQEQFWKIWEQFEILHGSEDTFRDYMKIKRSIAAQYSALPADTPFN